MPPEPWTIWFDATTIVTMWFIVADFTTEMSQTSDRSIIGFRVLNKPNIDKSITNKGAWSRFEMKRYKFYIPCLSAVLNKSAVNGQPSFGFIDQD